MSSNGFKVGKDYHNEAIKAELGKGNWGQVIVISADRGVICVRFQPDINSAWMKRNELWIYDTDKRVRDAERWANSGICVPVFHGTGKSGWWRHLGTATAKATHSGIEAKQYTGKSEVGLVLQMQYASNASAA